MPSVNRWGYLWHKSLCVLFLTCIVFDRIIEDMSSLNLPTEKCSRQDKLFIQNVIRAISTIYLYFSLSLYFVNQSEPVFSWSQVKVWVSWSDPQMCWWNAFSLICGSNCRWDLTWVSWSAVWSPLVKRAVSIIFNNIKHRTVSLRQLSYLLKVHVSSTILLDMSEQHQSIFVAGSSLIYADNV